MADRELKVLITGDASSLHKALGQAGKSSSKLSSGLKTLGKVAALGVGAAFAGLAATLKVGFDELADGQKVAAQTAAVLKSTGGAANVTAKHVDELAQSLSKMTGIDDEVIGAGENMLLTFKGIRNEVGKGNDIFDQSTKILTDMSVALGTDMNKSAIQLGKALNDPIKGITALTRVGVTFTEGQKKQIKAMVDAGNTMGAQKIILAELNSEFGGSAKAFGETLPGQLSKLRNSFDDLAAQIATAVLPALTGVVAFLNSNMPAIQSVVAQAMSTIGSTIRDLAPTIQQVFETARRNVQNFIDTARQILPTLQSLGGTALSVGLSSFGQSAIAATASMIAFHSVAVRVADALIKLRTATATAGLAGLIGPIGLLTAGVGLLAFAFYKTKIASDDVTSSLDRQKNAVLGLKDAANESANSHQRLRDANIAVKQATLDVSTALQRRNQLEKDGKKGTDEFKQSQLDVERAYSNRKRAELEVIAAGQALTKATKEQSGAVKELSAASKNLRTDAAQLTQALGGAGKEVEKKAVVAGYAREMNNLAKQARQVAEETKKVSPQISAAASAFARQATAAANVAKKTGEIPAAFRLVVGPSRTAGQAIGAALSAGVVAGIAQGAPGVRAAAADIVSQAEQAARARAQAKSPSELFAAIGGDLGEGMKKGLESKYKALSDTSKTAIDKMITAAVAAIQARQGALGEAVGTLVSSALSAFDALHEGVKTRAEKALEAFDLRQVVAENKKRIAELKAALVDAANAMAAFKTEQAAKEPLTQKEGETDAEFLQRKIDAQKAYNDEYENLIKSAADAQAALTAEQQAQALAKQRDALQRKAETSRKAEDDQTALERYRFQRRLEALQAALDSHHISYQKFITKVKKLFADNEIPMKDRGALLGRAVAAGLRDALIDVESAAQALARAIKNQLEKITVAIHVQYIQDPGGNPTHRQHGGPVKRRGSYIIGEAGPELFIPDTAGRVIANNRMGQARGMGGVIEVHSNVYLDGKQIHESVQRQEARYKNNNGRSAFA